MAHNHTQLQNLIHKGNELLKEYAQRWRKLAARFQPPMLDRELVCMFIGTLQGPYLEKMVGNVSLSFSDLVIVREHIESMLKCRKIQNASSSQASESESLGSSQDEERMKVMQYGKLTRLYKLHIWCLPISTRMYQLFNVSNLLDLHIKYHSFHMVNILLKIKASSVSTTYFTTTTIPTVVRSSTTTPVHPKAKKAFRSFSMLYSQVLSYLIKDGLVVPKEMNPTLP